MEGYEPWPSPLPPTPFHPPGRQPALKRPKNFAPITRAATQTPAHLYPDLMNPRVQMANV